MAINFKMNQPSKSNYRFLLSLLFRVLVIIGLLLVLTPFISSMFNNSNNQSTESNINSQLTISLSTMSAGSIKKIKMAYTPIWIYKRRTTEITQLDQLTTLLVDPLSAHSLQDSLLQNHHRSYNPVYFVFKPIESIRSCQIRFLDNPGYKLQQLLSAQQISWLGGFTESCFGSVYDLAGRRFTGTGKASQLNLPIPAYLIKNTKQQGDVIQFNLKTVVLN